MGDLVSITTSDGWWVGVYDKGSATSPRKSAHRVLAWGLTADGKVVPVVERPIGHPEPLNYSETREHIRTWHADGNTTPPPVP